MQTGIKSYVGNEAPIWRNKMIFFFKKMDATEK